MLLPRVCFAFAADPAQNAPQRQLKMNVGLYLNATSGRNPLVKPNGKGRRHSQQQHTSGRAAPRGPQLTLIALRCLGYHAACTACGQQAGQAAGQAPPAGCSIGQAERQRISCCGGRRCRSRFGGRQAGDASTARLRRCRQAAARPPAAPRAGGGQAALSHAALCRQLAAHKRPSSTPSKRQRQQPVPAAAAAAAAGNGACEATLCWP